MRCEIQLRSRDREKVRVLLKLPLNCSIRASSMHCYNRINGTAWYGGDGRWKPWCMLKEEKCFLFPIFLATPTARLLCSRPQAKKSSPHAGARAVMKIGRLTSPKACTWHGKACLGSNIKGLLAALALDVAPDSPNSITATTRNESSVIRRLGLFTLRYFLILWLTQCNSHSRDRFI